AAPTAAASGATSHCGTGAAPRSPPAAHRSYPRCSAASPSGAQLVLRPHRFAVLVVVAGGCAVTSDPTAGGAVAEPVRVRRLTDQEGQRLQQIVRRGSTNSVRYRRAMMLLASAGGNRVPVIAQLVQAHEAPSGTSSTG